MKKFFYLMASAIAVLNFSACEEKFAGLDVGSESDVLSIDGSCNIYTLPNKEESTWQIVSAPEWMTPVRMEGSSSDSIQVYVESNNSTPLRQGKIKVAYQNGTTRSIATFQSDEQPTWSLQRSYAVGWSFDVRTYNDVRGLRQQIFNTQKMKADNPYAYCMEPSQATVFQFYYGEDVTRLQSDMSGKLNLSTDSVNFNTFSLSLKGNFGKSSLSNSKRIFSWIRQVYGEQTVYLAGFDETDAQESGWFTADFAAVRQSVINSQGNDASVSRLIEMYGTHFVINAVLGGCFDYYYSTELSEDFDSLKIEGSINFGFNKKFNLDITGNAEYENTFKEMGTETIEKFSVSGGNAITLARAVEDGSIDAAAINAWRESIRTDGKYELMTFELISIAALFPDEISAKITDYMRRMYYNELPLTRMSIENEM